MANMPSVNRSNLAVRLDNAVLAAVEKAAAERGISNAEIAREWIGRMAAPIISAFTAADRARVEALRAANVRRRRSMMSTTERKHAQ